MANTYTQIYIHAAKKEARIPYKSIIIGICDIPDLSVIQG